MGAKNLFELTPNHALEAPFPERPGASLVNRLAKNLIMRGGALRQDQAKREAIGREKPRAKLLAISCAGQLARRGRKPAGQHCERVVRSMTLCGKRSSAGHGGSGGFCVGFRHTSDRCLFLPRAPG